MTSRYDPEEPDFSALHEDTREGRTPHHRFRDVHEDAGPLPEGPPEDDILPGGDGTHGAAPASAVPARDAGWPRGLTRALAAAVVMVGVSSLLIAGSAVVYAVRQGDTEERVAELLAASSEGTSSGRAAAGSEEATTGRHSRPRHGKDSGKAGSSHRGSRGGAGDVAGGGAPGGSAGAGSAGAGSASAGGRGGAAGSDPSDPEAVSDVEDDADDAVTADDADADDAAGDAGDEVSSGPEWVDGVLMLRMAEPTVDDFAAQFRYIIDPNVPDAGIRANVDGGLISVPAVRFMQKTIELNRSNNWQWHFHGPVEVDGDTATVWFVDSANGYPDAERQLILNKIDGNWRYSRQTVCSVLAAHGGGPQCS